MDLYSSKKRSEIMSKIRGKETGIEVKVRKFIWKKGYRYRKNCTSYFGKPDILLKKYKAVIFIDSCFWHGCRKHYRTPATRKSFWIRKIERNKIRDKEVNLHYKKEHWLVVRIWEHDLKKRFEKTIEKKLLLLKEKL